MSHEAPKHIADEFDRISAPTYAAFGQFIPTWDAVEKHVARVFLIVTRPVDHSAALAGYITVVSFAARFAITDAAARRALPPGLKSKWTELQVRITSTSAIRNRLVHSEFLAFHKDGANASGLVPADVSDLKLQNIRDFKNNAYDDKKINIALDRVQKLNRDLKSFNQEIEQHFKYVLPGDMLMLYRRLKR